MSAVDMATRVERLPGAVPTRLWSEKSTVAWQLRITYTIYGGVRQHC